MADLRCPLCFGRKEALGLGMTMQPCRLCVKPKTIKPLEIIAPDPIPPELIALEKSTVETPPACKDSLQVPSRNTDKDVSKNAKDKDKETAKKGLFKGKAKK